jgi:O-antigen/teichoic acid export membrane protein
MIIFKKIFSGGKENLIDRFLTILIRFGEPIIFLSFLSVEGYGEWLILITIPAYLSISELGFGDVITNEINMFKERKKIIYCKYLFQNLLKFIIYITIFFLIISFLIIGNFNFFDFQTFTYEELKQILMILFIYTLIVQINSVFTKFLSINDRYNLSVKLAYFNKSIEFILISIFLFLYQNLVYVALSLLIVKLFFLMVSIYYVKKYVKWFSLENFNKFRITIRKRFLLKFYKKSILYSAMPIGQIFKIQAATLIIGSTLGPAALVIINIYLTLARLPIQIANIADGIIKIELAKLYIVKKFTLFKNYYITNIYLTLFITLSYLLLIIFFGEIILLLWLDEKILYYEHIFNILMIYGFIHTINISISSPLFSTNNFKILSVIFLITGILSTLILILFAKNFGLAAVAINFIFFEAMYFVACFWLSKKQFNLNNKDYKLNFIFVSRIINSLF